MCQRLYSVGRCVRASGSGLHPPPPKKRGDKVPQVCFWQILGLVFFILRGWG